MRIYRRGERGVCLLPILVYGRLWFSFLLATEVILDVGFDALVNVLCVALDEGLAYDVLIELDVTLRYAVYIFVAHFGHLLTLLTHKSILNEPLAYKFFGELFLGLAFFEFFLIAVGIEVTR